MTPAHAYLLAALDLDNAGRDTFGVADLTVAVWRRCPPRFGIPGYRCYPDKHRVASDLARAGDRAPLDGVNIEKVGRGRYRLTPAGRAAAERLARTPTPTTSTAS